ncbi:MAG: hypothetical protein Q9217_000924 [Psora testacea]
MPHGDSIHMDMIGQQDLPRHPVPPSKKKQPGPQHVKHGSDITMVDSEVAKGGRNAAPGASNLNNVAREPIRRREEELEIIRKTRHKEIKYEHRDTEQFRRSFFGLVLLDLREEALDVVAELDANNLDQFTKHLPIEIIKEKDAHNNKRGITKNSSLIAGIIKIKALKEENEALKATLMSRRGCTCIRQSPSEDARSDLCSSLTHWVVIDDGSSVSSEAAAIFTPSSSTGSSGLSSPRPK